MWIMTTSGFYSAVQHNDDPNLLVVRTRVKDDARTLARYIVHLNFDLERQKEVDPDMLIVENEYSDYPFRVIVNREDFREFVSESVNNLSYPNFKDEVKHVQGFQRASVYSGVWATLLRLEDNDPEGRRTSYDDEDEDYETPRRSLADRIRNRRFYDWDTKSWARR